MQTPVRVSATALIVALIAVALIVPWSELHAQSLPRLFDAAQPGARPTERPVRPHQARKARLRLDVLDAPAFELNLFDNAQRVAKKTKVERLAADRFVWHGRTDDDGIVTFAVVKGVATGTVFLDGRSFEITSDADGDYTIAELNSAAFPTEDAPLEAPDQAADTAGTGTTGTATVAADGATQIDVLVVYTPAARTAAGGTAAIESLVLSAVANANLAYTNSLVNAQLRLVHSAEVSFTETPSNMSGDLSSFRGTTDGTIDSVHSLRDQYGADVVTMIGSGYAAAGYCGLGYLMTSPSTSFASSAFNIVDRTCAAGYLSYAHEVGHNQGLHHDPANAGSTPSYPYAYGYQDPGGVFRTVLSYGGATRVPYLSNPSVLYSGRVTGTSSQDNARALNNNAATVAAFRSTAGSTPTCSYTVSPTSLSFQSDSSTATVSVTTTAGCTWTSSSTSSWASVSGGGTGSGTATVAVMANGTSSRSATIVVAGKYVTVSQEAAAATCSYSVSPTSLSFAATAGSKTVTVTTSSGCAWTSSSASWATVAGSGSASGTATVSVPANSGAARTTTLVVAGTTVSVSQAAPKGKGNGNRR